MACPDENGASQTFCKLNGQYVKNQPGLLQTFNGSDGITKHTTFVLASIWNTIREQLSRITKYGTYGTKNDNILPYNSSNDTVTNCLNEKTANQDIIPLSEYNSLLTKLSKTNLAEGSLVTAERFNNLYTYLQDYQLNSDRCNTCNLACNAGCQIASQCSCDSNCDDGPCYAGGQGCSCGSQACGSGGCVAGEG